MMGLRPFLFLCFLCLTAYSCKPKIKSYSITDFSNLTKEKEVDGYKRPCSEYLNCVPDEYTLPKVVRVNVHLIDSPEEEANFPLKEGKKFYKDIINNANERLGRNTKMNLPLGNTTPVIDPGFRYKVVGSKKQDDGFYYHKDKDHYYYLNKGKKKNNYNKGVIKKFAIEADSILNIFAISHPQDSLDIEGYSATKTGIALGTSLKISGIYSNRHQKPWEFGTLLNHEIGHVLGLAHAWTKYDGCEDTPVHPNCWDENSKSPCDGSFSNNVMDYNRSQMAYTPCQIGKIHKAFNQLNTKTRGLIYEDWCVADSSSAIQVSEHFDWKGDRDLNRNIEILPGGTLELHCRLSMAENTSITIHDGGKLILHSYAKIHNACNATWEGIKILSTKKEIDHIKIYGEPKLLNVKGVPLNTNNKYDDRL